MPVDDLRPKISALMPQAKQDLAQLVSFRSVANTDQQPVEDCLKAAHYVADAFTTVGLGDVRLVDMPLGEVRRRLNY